MIERKDWIDADKLKALNATVYKHGRIDREDVLSFLRLIETTDADVIISELKKWMTDLHNDPAYDKVILPEEQINAIIGDLDSYGVVQSETILKMKEDSVRNIL